MSVSQKAVRPQTKTDILRDNQRLIRELHGLSRLRIAPPSAGTTNSLGGTPSGAGASGGVGNFLHTQGDTMIGPIAYFPVDVFMDEAGFIDIGQNSGSANIPDYSSYVLMTAGTNKTLELIKGAGFSGQWLILQTALTQKVTIQDFSNNATGNIVTSDGNNVVMDGTTSAQTATLIFDVTVSPNGNQGGWRVVTFSKGERGSIAASIATGQTTNLDPSDHVQFNQVNFAGGLTLQGQFPTNDQTSGIFELKADTTYYLSAQLHVEFDNTTVQSEIDDKVGSGIFVRLSADQTTNLGAGDHVEFDDSSTFEEGLTLSTGAGQANGIISSFEVGDYYDFSCPLEVEFSGNSGELVFAWFLNGVEVGARGHAIPVTASGGANRTSPSPIAESVRNLMSPSDTMEVRFITSTNVATITAAESFGWVQEVTKHVFSEVSPEFMDAVWFDRTGSVSLGKSLHVEPQFSTSNDTNKGVCEILFSPTVDTEVELQITGSNFVRAIQPFSTAIIQESGAGSGAAGAPVAISTRAAEASLALSADDNTFGVVEWDNNEFFGDLTKIQQTATPGVFRISGDVFRLRGALDLKGGGTEETEATAILGFTGDVVNGSGLSVLDWDDNTILGQSAFIIDRTADQAGVFQLVNNVFTIEALLEVNTSGGGSGNQVEVFWERADDVNFTTGVAEIGVKGFMATGRPDDTTQPHAIAPVNALSADVFVRASILATATNIVQFEYTSGTIDTVLNLDAIQSAQITATWQTSGDEAFTTPADVGLQAQILTHDAVTQNVSTQPQLETVVDATGAPVFVRTFTTQTAGLSGSIDSDFSGAAIETIASEGGGAGSALTWITASLSTDQVLQLGAGNHVEWDTVFDTNGNITLQTGSLQINGIFELIANRTYYMEQFVRGTFSGPTGSATIQWTDTSGTPLGTTSNITPQTNASDVSNLVSSAVIFTPTVDTNVETRIISSSLLTAIDSASSYVNIFEVGVIPGGGGGGGHIIQDEGVSLAQQPALNFIGLGVQATDNPGLNSTDVEITGGVAFPLLYPIRDFGTVGNQTVAVPLDQDTSHVGIMTLNGDISISFTNPPATDNFTGELIITQDGTGGHNVSFVNTINQTVTFDTTANARNVMTYQTSDGGTTFDVFIAGATGGGGGGADNLNELTDVTLTSPSDNNVFQFDGGTSQWVNRGELLFGGLPRADSGFIRYPNNEIMLAARNGGDDGNLEFKTVSPATFDFTDSGKNVVAIRTRTQDPALGPDNNISMSVGATSLAEANISTNINKISFDTAGFTRLTLDSTIDNNLNLETQGSGFTKISALNVISKHITEPDNTISMSVGAGIGADALISTGVDKMRFDVGGQIPFDIDSNLNIVSVFDDVFQVFNTPSGQAFSITNLGTGLGTTQQATEFLKFTFGGTEFLRFEDSLNNMILSDNVFNIFNTVGGQNFSIANLGTGLGTTQTAVEFLKFNFGATEFLRFEDSLQNAILSDLSFNVLDTGTGENFSISNLGTGLGTTQSAVEFLKFSLGGGTNHMQLKNTSGTTDLTLQNPTSNSDPVVLRMLANNAVDPRNDMFFAMQSGSTGRFLIFSETAEMDLVVDGAVTGAITPNMTLSRIGSINSLGLLQNTMGNLALNFRALPSTATAGDIAEINFVSKTSADTINNYARIVGGARQVTDGIQDGELTFFVDRHASLQTVMEMNGISINGRIGVWLVC